MISPSCQFIIPLLVSVIGKTPLPKDFELLEVRFSVPGAAMVVVAANEPVDQFIIPFTVRVPLPSILPPEWLSVDPDGIFWVIPVGSMIVPGLLIIVLLSVTTVFNVNEVAPITVIVAPVRFIVPLFDDVPRQVNPVPFANDIVPVLLSDVTSNTPVFIVT